MDKETVKTIFHDFLAGLSTHDYGRIRKNLTTDFRYVDCLKKESKGADQFILIYSNYIQNINKIFVFERLQYFDDGFNKMVGWGDYVCAVGMGVTEDALLPMTIRACFNSNLINEIMIMSSESICPLVKQ